MALRCAYELVASEWGLTDLDALELEVEVLGGLLDRGEEPLQVRHDRPRPALVLAEGLVVRRHRAELGAIDGGSMRVGATASGSLV